MTVEGETTAGHEAKAAKAHKFLGSLRDALMAAGRDDAPIEMTPQPKPAPAAKPITDEKAPPPLPPKPQSLSAELTNSKPNCGRRATARLPRPRSLSRSAGRRA